LPVFFFRHIAEVYYGLIFLGGELGG
jgi:hypothetical protein